MKNTTCAWCGADGSSLEKSLGQPVEHHWEYTETTYPPKRPDSAVLVCLKFTAPTLDELQERMDARAEEVARARQELRDQVRVSDDLMFRRFTL